MKRVLSFASLAAALVTLSGCVTFRRPEVTFRAVEVVSIGSAGAELEAAFDVTNPNSYEIRVRHLTYRITLNGREAGGGTVETETLLPGHAMTPVHLPLTLDWEKIRSAGLGLLMGGVDYAVEGEITFSAPMGTFRRPYSHAGHYAGLAER